MKYLYYILILYFMTLVTSTTCFAQTNASIRVPGSNVRLHFLTAEGWTKRLQEPNGTPVILEHLIYEIDNTSLVAMKRDTGEVIWRVSLLSKGPEIKGNKTNGNEKRPTFTLSAVQETVFVSESDEISGKVIALEAKTGAKRWTYLTGEADKRSDHTYGAVLSQPVVWKDSLIFRTGQGLTSISVNNGREIWHIPFDPYGDVPLTSSAIPAVDSRGVYFNCDFGIVYAFDGKTGETLWATPTSAIEVTKKVNTMKVHITFTYCPPVTTATQVFVADGLGNVYCLRKSDGHVIWQSSKGHAYHLFASGSFLYAATAEGFFQLNASNGVTLRSFGNKQKIILCEQWGKYCILGNYPSDWEIMDLDNWQIMHKVSGTRPTAMVMYKDMLYVEGSADSESSQSLQAFKLSNLIRDKAGLKIK